MRSTKNQSTPGYARALALAVCLVCAVVAIVIGAGSLSADAAGTLSVDPDPAGTAAAAADALAAQDGEKSAGASAASTSDAATYASDSSSHAGSFSTAEISDTLKVYFQVLVNGEWRFLDAEGNLYSSSADVPADKIFSTNSHAPTMGGTGRFVVRGDDLERAYGLFGFDAQDLIEEDNSAAGQRFFGVSDCNNIGTIWADIAPVYEGFLGSYQDGGCEAAKWAIPLVRNTPNNLTQPARLYYLPANREGTTSYFTTSRSTTNEQLISDNTFYSVQVSDDAHLVYAEGEDLPAAQYVFTGGRCSVTVKAKATGSQLTTVWTAVSNGEKITPSSQEASADGSELTLTFDSVTGPISVMPATSSDSYLVSFKADTLSESRVDLGDTAAASQKVLQDGKINGGNGSCAYNVSVGESLTLPNLDAGFNVGIVQRTNAGAGAANRRFFYTFVGWEVSVGGVTTVMQPGETLTADQVANLSPSGSSISFKAKWKATEDPSGKIQSVNFYVNRTFEIADNMGNGFTTKPTAEDFTDSIFATRLTGAGALTGGGSNLVLLAPPGENDNAYTVDSILRKMTSVAYVPDNSGLYTDGFTGILLDSFPSDAEVLESVRNSGKDLVEDGQPIDKSTITPDNYAVRWYTLKYNNSDGWHVDGVLVRKEGRLTVTKTFAGDPTAVAQAKASFSIEVTHESDEGTVSDYSLALQPADEAGEGKTGYTSYDATTDTYTWSLSARQGTEYTLAEKNYELAEDSDWSSGSWYKISNSSAETGGWLPYVGAGEAATPVKATAESYANDTPAEAVQTVAFRNVYVKANTVTLSKVDSVTGNPISGVSFTLTREDNAQLSLYQRSDGSNFYSVSPSEEYGKLVEDNKITTGSDGNIYIAVGAAASELDSAYTLVEDTPLGYKSARGAILHINASGRLSGVDELLADGSTSSTSGWFEVSTDGSTLIVRNVSEILTSVRALKDWGTTAADQQKPVTVSLYRNGAKLVGDQYTQVLSKENDWTYTWENLPLFIDGELASYTLREDKIGDVIYDAGADADGYSDYLVTQDKARYSDSLHSANPDDYKSEAYWQGADDQWHFATHALIVLHNVPTTGEVAFAKVDGAGNPLKGASFGLYLNCYDEHSTYQATSDDNGRVTFGLMHDGMYWMRERTAPQGYALDEDTWYKVTVRGGVATITREDDPDATSVSQIVNHFQASVTVWKINAKGDLLAGATVKLYSIDMSTGKQTYLDEKVTDDTGRVTFEDLPVGDYVLEETGAPAGYMVPGEDEDDVAHVVVEEGAVYVINGGGPSWKFYKGATANEAHLVLTDRPLFELPTTGGPGIFAVTAGGVALMCGAAWLWLRLRERGGRVA